MLGKTQKQACKKPFRAYIKEVYDGGNFFLLSDGFHECRAKLLPSAKTFLKENYPGFCQFKADSICKCLVSISDYNFVANQKNLNKYTMARTSLSLSIEIGKMQIIVADRIEEHLLQKKKFKNMQTGEMTTF